MALGTRAEERLGTAPPAVTESAAPLEKVFVRLFSKSRCLPYVSPLAIACHSGTTGTAGAATVRAVPAGTLCRAKSDAV